MLDGNLQEWEEYEARLSDDSRETFATEVAQETLPGKSFEVDPCASIRSAMAPEHANLSAGAVTLLLGHMPAAFALHQYLNSTEMRQTTLASLLGKAALRSVRVNGSDISIPAYLRLVSHLCSEVAEQSESQGERPAGNADEAPYTFEIPLSRREFRVDHLPRGLQAKFANEDSPAWREAVAEAMHSGVRDPKELADLIFFMQHRRRVERGVGQLIKTDEPDFVKLRAEWDLYETIANRRLNPSAACPLFFPANPSSNYEQYMAKPTTGLITLMVNGRTSGKVQIEAFDSMRQTVESLGPGDSLFLANWQFTPAQTPLTTPPSGATWADLLKKKAIEGVKIRVIISDLPPAAAAYQTNLKLLDDVISGLPDSARDNWKYIFTRHPANLIATHHQKVMVATKCQTVIAYCGGLDISFNRIPTATGTFVWHDVHAKLEGQIARDVEREFVLRWNREKDKSTAVKLGGWKDFEILTPAIDDSSDRGPGKNRHKLQMLRTVSVGRDPADIRRDDVWQAYFRLIGCASRFLFLENQYFHEPAMADAIVKQTEAQPALIVIVVASSVTDDKKNVLTNNMLALRHEFFSRLFKGIPSSRLRVYTMCLSLVHSKLIIVDDRALSMGSANANPRDFFLDTQINVMLDDAEAVKGFRQHLWAHDLGVAESTVAAWPISNFIAQWDAVAKTNEGLKKNPLRMAGEGIISFNPTTEEGQRLGSFLDILSEQVGEPPRGNEGEAPLAFESESQFPVEQSLQVKEVEESGSSGELQESAGQGENSRSSENAESSASEYIAGTEQEDFRGESAPWLREYPVGGDGDEYEWRALPSKKKVSDTFAVPFRWICKVSVLKNGKYDGGGSGVLISDRHVLTAAHVVYDVIRDPVQYDLEVRVALDGNMDLGMSARSGKPCIPSQYDPDKTDFDYALITLSSPVGQTKPDGLKGAKLCFWGSPECGAGTVLVRVEPKSLVTQNAWTAGYPKNKGQSAMWCFIGILADVGEKDRIMVYTGELTEGQSGSPTWIQRDGKYILVGIAVARGSANRVVRVTRELCRQLASWMGTQQHEVAEDRPGGDFESEEAVIGQNASPLSIFEVWPSELADLEEHQVAPQGLILLDHVHKPKTPDPGRPGAFTVGALAKLTASDLNPLFIDARDSLVTDTTPTGLQRCLNALISNGFEGLLGSRGQTAPGPHDRVHVALVDLTGTKLTAPEFAGWGATTDVNGASVPKIVAVYGAFQLRFELRDLVTRRSPADGNQLESMAVAEWRAKGLTAQVPDLVWLFNIRKWLPSAILDFTPVAQSALAHLVHNCEAGTFVAKVSLPYIGSLAWQSGLFHPTRSGLWLKSSYCGKGDWDSPVKVPNVHNVTALSAATYFTLLAQGRLVDDASSASIVTALRHGCVTSFFPRLPVVASKCGILGGFIHDCAWIQDGSVRYAIAVLSRLETAVHQHLYTRLCGELDTLIRMNNQIPKSPCLP